MTFAAFMKKQTMRNELLEIGEQVRYLAQLAFEAGEDEGFAKGKRAGLLEAQGKKRPAHIARGLHTPRKE